MIAIEQAIDKRTGNPTNLFFIRNGSGKVLALGVIGAWMLMKCPRYERDRPLVAKILNLTKPLNVHFRPNMNVVHNCP